LRIFRVDIEKLAHNFVLKKTDEIIHRFIGRL
jgi:hypothetical protein